MDLEDILETTQYRTLRIYDLEFEFYKKDEILEMLNYLFRHSTNPGELYKKIIVSMRDYILSLGREQAIEATRNLVIFIELFGHIYDPYKDVYSSVIPDIEEYLRGTINIKYKFEPLGLSQT